MDRIQMREEITRRALEEMKIEEPGWLAEILREAREPSPASTDASSDNEDQ